MGCYVLLLLFVSITAFNCSQSAGQREAVRFPEAVYQSSPDSLPFRFDVSRQAVFAARENKEGEYFCDVVYPLLKAQLYCTWHRITPEVFPVVAEESHAIAYSHVQMATSIDEKFYANEPSRVYGILYDIKGPVATPLQVALTDSLTFFFNASLYFDAVPDADSIAPYLDYLRKDVVRLMESFVPLQY